MVISDEPEGESGVTGSGWRVSTMGIVGEDENSRPDTFIDI
jgi:hypothetical protein